MIINIVCVQIVTLQHFKTLNSDVYISIFLPLGVVEDLDQCMQYWDRGREGGFRMPVTVDYTCK